MEAVGKVETAVMAAMGAEVNQKVRQARELAQVVASVAVGGLVEAQGRKVQAVDPVAPARLAAWVALRTEEMDLAGRPGVNAQ